MDLADLTTKSFAVRSDGALELEIVRSSAAGK